VTHPTREQWIDYFSGEAADEESLEAHLMSCGACASSAAEVAAIVEALRQMIAATLTASGLERLRARGVRVREHPLAPGGPHDAVFPADADVLLFRLAGLDLSRAADVQLTMRVEDTGAVLMTDRASFDRNGGELLLACQRHFASFPPNAVAEVRVRDDDGRESTTRYTIHHHYPAP
jgi:anti-sigma factor RsiW